MAEQLSLIWCSECGRTDGEFIWKDRLCLCPTCYGKDAQEEQACADTPGKPARKSKWQQGTCRLCHGESLVQNGVCAECKELDALPIKVVARIRKLDPDLYGGLSLRDIRELMVHCSDDDFDLTAWRRKKIMRRVAVARMDKMNRCNQCRHQVLLDREVDFWLGDAYQDGYPCLTCPVDVAAGNRRWCNFQGKAAAKK